MTYGVDDIQRVVQQWLENQGIVANFAELATHLEPFRNPFASMETEYMQSKFYRDHFNLVVRTIDRSRIPLWNSEIILLFVYVCTATLFF